MKLHPTVVEKLIRVYTTYGGHREETKLRSELLRLDLTSYTQQAGGGDTFLVLTEDVIRHQANKT
tara:strand:+ start:112 stop:306 length:195 start_codon:yes stop_codon:yes gene_type:complete